MRRSPSRRVNFISASPNAPAGALLTDGFTVPVGTGSIPGDWALDLALVEAQVAEDPVLEFHGDAAAPEGALYVNGQLVGHVLGVSRL